jgi:cell division protease FtsH
MITDYGMSETLGPVHFGDPDSGPRYLGGLYGKSRDYSDLTAQSIDAEVRTIIERIEAKVLRILEQNRGVLEDMAQQLLSREVVETDHLAELVGRVRRLDEDEERATQNGTVEEVHPPPDGVVPEPHEPA